MKKIILFLVLLSMNVLADVPADNRMKLGEISKVLPGTEMQNYYLKMEPIMLKYFGPPFSNFILTIEADPTKNEHATGFQAEKQTLLLAGQARDYVRFKDSNPEFALENIYSSMRHELSHGMYMYEKDMFSFGKQWPWEGWAKVLEEMLIKESEGGDLPGLRNSYCYYMDKEIIGGTEGWGGSKQITNHVSIYNVVGGVHLLLVYAASSSYSSLDFYKKMNNVLYDYIKSHKKAHLSLDEYKSVMKPLLAGVKIDGRDAFEWYFDNPAAFSDGNLGGQINTFTENDDRFFKPTSVIAYAFDRQNKENGKKEIALSGQEIKVILEDSQGKEVWNKVILTDADGNAREDIFDEAKNWEEGAYSVYGEAKINNKLIATNYFVLNPPEIEVNKNYLYGVLLNSNKNLVSGKYVSLLQADAPFIYKKNGLFILDVPAEQKTITLDFLGKKQEVTKAPFARLFAFTAPESYLALAEGKSAEELEQGAVEAPEDLKKPADRLGKPADDKGCGNNICEEFERETQGCPEDCGGPLPRMERMERVEKTGIAERIDQAEKIKPPEEKTEKGFFVKVISWLKNLFK